MLKNAYLLAKIGADTAENERNFAEILPKIWLAEHVDPDEDGAAQGSYAYGSLNPYT